jgi:hypothetical protein
MTYQVDKCFFDWYQCSVNDSIEKVQDWLSKEYPEADQSPTKPKNGAGQAIQLTVGGSVIVQAIWGGGMPDGMINIWSTGYDAIRFAQLVKDRYPLVHKVSRADAAINFDSSGAWDFFYNWGCQLAEKHKLKVEYAGNHLTGVGGRTIYIGSPLSATRLVIYEKGKQIPELDLPNLVRVELRVKPKGWKAGCQVGSLKPKDLYKCSKWAIDAGEYLFSDNGWQRVVIGTRWTKSDAEKARSAFIKQYSGVIGDWVAELGSWQALGQEIGERVARASIERERILSYRNRQITSQQGATESEALSENE